MKHIIKKVFSIVCTVAMIISILPVQNISAANKANSYLPKTVETEKVLVFDMSQDLKKRDANAKEAYMAITSIQGIVNRTSKTKIFLTNTPQEHDWTPYNSSQSWLDKGIIPADAEYPALNYGKKYPVLSYLLEHYQNEIKGMVQVPSLSGTIVDGAVMAGVTVAGVEDSILVSSSVEKYIANEGYSFPVKANTRGFKSNIEAFDWAFENYFDKCNKAFVAQHSYTAFGGGMDDQFPIFYDYLISSQVFVFCLDGNKKDELAKIKTFLVPENYAPGTAVLGLPVDEGKGIACLSDQGYYLAIMYVPNLSVTSSYENDISEIKKPSDPVAPETIDNNKNYVAFFATDGDSMGFPTYFMYEHITNSPYRGMVPIGWSYNPHLVELFPTLLSYYSKNNYNSFYEYVGSMNNGGSPNNDKAYEVYKERYANYVKQTNGMLRVINYFNDEGYTEGVTKAVNPYLLIKGYQGQTDGNETQWGKTSDGITYTTMSGATQGNAKPENMYKALKKIADNENADGPTFTIVCCGDGRHSGDPARQVYEAIEKLKADGKANDFVFMRPSDLAATYKAYNGDTTVTKGNPKVFTCAGTSAVNEILLEKNSVNLVEGRGTSVKGFPLDEDQQYVDKKVTYTSANSSIAKVDENGNITALKEGSTSITVSCEGKTASISVKVEGRKPASIATDKEVFSTAVGQKVSISADLFDQFGGKLDRPIFVWETSNEEVATVDNGVVTAKGIGNADITISYQNVKKVVKVSVLESADSISRVVIEPSYLEMNVGDILSAKVNAYDSDNHEVFGFMPKWTVEDNNLATVTDDGYVTGIKAGKTRLIATYGDKISQSIDLLIKEEEKSKIRFEDVKKGDSVGKVAGVVTFESGAYTGYGPQGEIQGNAIKLNETMHEKALTFENDTVLKSIKVYNPTDETRTVTLKSGSNGAVKYEIPSRKTLTLKTNFQKSEKTFVIQVDDAEIATQVAFGEFVYGDPDQIPTTLKIDQAVEYLSVTKGESLNITVSLYDQNGKKMKPEFLEFSTDRDDIVSVNEKGIVTGVEIGSTFIYAKAHGLVASTLVYVTDSEITKLETTPKTGIIYIGETIPLSTKAFDKDGNELYFPALYTSENESVVKVVDNKYIQAVGKGSTYIDVNVSGKKEKIHVYVADRPTSDNIITFENQPTGENLPDQLDDRVKFEGYFFHVAENVPGINGKAIHLHDAGEKAFWIKPAPFLKSFKAHNPTNQDIQFKFKKLAGSTVLEYTIPAGKTLTFYTGLIDKIEGYVFEAPESILFGEIVYTDTLATGLSAKEVADGLTYISQPQFAQDKLVLPEVLGFNVEIASVSEKDIIADDGTLNPLGVDKDVQVTLKITNNLDKGDEATTLPITVKVLGVPANKTELSQKVDEMLRMDLSLYTKESIDVFNTVLKEAQDALVCKEIRQSEVDTITKKLNNAIDALTLKKADYGEVDKAIEAVKKLNKNNYRDFSKVEKSVANVVRGKNITEQDDVNAMAKAINDAINALVLKNADYNEVEKAIANAKNIDRNKYTEESLAQLDKAIELVARDLDITKQAEVDAMAKAINDAFASLIEKTVITPDPKPGDDNINKPSDDYKPTTPNNSEEKAKTGDNVNIVLPITMLVLAGVGMILAKKRKED